MDASNLLLYQHARIHAADVAEVEGGSIADLTFQGLADDQFRLRPGKGLNSLAWIVWHMARTEDVVANVIVGGRRQVLDEEGWLPRLSVPRRDIGTGMTTEEVDELTAKIDVAAVRAYRSAVGRRTRELLRALTPARMAEAIGAEAVAEATRQGAFGPNAKWLETAWPSRTRGPFLAFIAVAHNAMHLGEATTVRSQAGLGLGR